MQPQAATSTEFVRIAQKELNSPRELELKLAQACKMGFFYLEMPNECQALVDKAVQLGNTFYQKEEIRTVKLEGFSGYHDRPENQVESLYIEQAYWGTHLSRDLQELALRMKIIALEVLHGALMTSKIPSTQWDKGTGGVTDGLGQTHFTFNHYRHEKEKPGIDAHRDFGLVTVLFINKKGLQAKIEGVWSDVMPLENHFVVNFGQALEMFVNDPQKLTAAWHQVPQLNEDRISFGVFVDNANDSHIFIREKDGSLKDTGKKYEDYLKNNFSETYKD